MSNVSKAFSAFASDIPFPDDEKSGTKGGIRWERNGFYGCRVFFLVEVNFLKFHLSIKMIFRSARSHSLWRMSLRYSMMNWWWIRMIWWCISAGWFASSHLGIWFYILKVICVALSQRKSGSLSPLSVAWPCTRIKVRSFPKVPNPSNLVMSRQSRPGLW